MKQLDLFSHASSKHSSNYEHATSHRKTCYLYTDGAARNNPGPAGIGFVLSTDETVFARHGFYIGTATNNQAEYLALLVGLCVSTYHCKPEDTLIVRADSQLMIRQMKGIYKVKDKTLAQIKNIMEQYSKQCRLVFEHVRRADNKKADELANYGIDEKISLPKKILAQLCTAPILDKLSR